MDNKNNIENLFEELKGKFDINKLNSGHEARFLKKLNAESLVKDDKKSKPFWKPLLAIAASIVICISVIGFYGANQNEVLDLASVSPEMKEAQDFFSVTINEEFKKLNKERSPLTENIIQDVTKRLKTLENDYEKLKIDLTDNVDDKRIIYAMINNFQNRIDLLTEVLERIEDLKEFKNNAHATKNIL